MKIFSRFPVFRMVLPFSAGILYAIKTEISISTMASLAITGFVIAFAFTLRNYASGKYAQRWLAGIPFYCCFFGLGGSLTWVHQSRHHGNHFQDITQSGSFVIEIKSEPAKTNSGYRFIADVNAVKSQYEWQPVRGTLLVYLSDSLHEFKGTAGNKMMISGQVRKIRSATNPQAFDSKAFYASKGAWHRVNLTSGDFELIRTPVNKSAFTYARKLRDEMLSKLQKHLGKEDLGVAGALLLGYEEWLDPELENYWSGAGVLHVLCVSGMHVMLIYVILAGALAWMEKHRFLRHLRYILLLSLIWFYAMVTGFSPSVIRAAAMISFVIAGNWIHREASIYNLLCSSCILMFILDPYLIVSAGFQLSFLAVCGIIFLHRLILPLWIAPNRLLHKIWELVSVSLAAQLSTFPLSLFLFHQFPNYFLIGNLLIIPLSTAVMYSGLILLVTDWIPYAGLVTGAITSYGIKALNWLVVAIGRLPGALTENIYLSLFDTLTLYLLLIFIPVWLVYKSRSWLFICLILLSILLSNRIVMIWDASNKVQLTVYDSNRKTIISLLNGGKAILIRDTTADPKSLKFAAEEHLISNLVSASNSILVREGELLRMAGVFSQPIYILKDWKKRSRLPGNLNFESNSILVLGGHLSVNANELLNCGRPSLVIFDSSCKNYQVKKLEEGLKAKGVATYSVKERGAFQYP